MKALLLLAGLLLAAGAGFYLFRHSGTAKPDEHRQSLEKETAPLAAMMKAPDGATPCETAFNAFSAFDQTARANNVARPWTTLPERAVFVERCNRLSPQEQLCVQPRYQATNRSVCDPMNDRIRTSGVLWAQ